MHSAFFDILPWKFWLLCEPNFWWKHFIPWSPPCLLCRFFTRMTWYNKHESCFSSTWLQPFVSVDLKSKRTFIFLSINIWMFSLFTFNGSQFNQVYSNTLFHKNDSVKIWWHHVCHWWTIFIFVDIIKWKLLISSMLFAAILKMEIYSIFDKRWLRIFPDWQKSYEH